jgi:hypothetical protein
LGEIGGMIVGISRLVHAAGDALIGRIERGMRSSSGIGVVQQAAGALDRRLGGLHVLPRLCQ